MALAPFFDKAAQSARQVLTDFDFEAFAAALEREPVALAWDGTVGTSREGAATLELLVDLCARLYPVLRVIALDADAAAHIARVRAQAMAINPRLDIGEDGTNAAVVVVVGRTPFTALAAAPVAPVTPTILYAGSAGWLAAFSRSAPVGSGASANVFGAAAAACLAAANVFRAIFGAQLPHGALDDDVVFSLCVFAPVRAAGGGRSGTAPAASARDLLESLATDPRRNPPSPSRVELGDTHLAGVGAIGHAVVWALRRTPGLAGTLHLIDSEAYDDTNPQRYVATAHDAAGFKATAIAAGAWAAADLRVVPHDLPWADHVAAFTAAQGHWRITRVALALDTAADRVRVQAALPERVLNAWTQPDNLGISRHDFLQGPCVCCLYLPTGRVPNQDELIAAAFRITDALELKKVRWYVDTGAPLDLEALGWLADRIGADADTRQRMQGFAGRPLVTLYARGVCGGLLLPGAAPGDGIAAGGDVPVAFQSALAGILLAAEIVLDAAALRDTSLPPRTEIDLLRPLGRRLNAPQQRPPQGGCLCQDPDYVQAYRAKYRADVPSAVRSTPSAEHHHG